MADPDLPPLREVIARHGLRALKAYGQHFLLDANLTRRIARAAGDLGAGTTIEIGPGPGGLTRALLAEGAGKVLAIEKDRRCVAALADLAEAYPGRLEVMAGDALKAEIGALGAPPRRVVANLPYNVATALLTRWLTAIFHHPACLESLTVTLQKEVAGRLTAAPGGRAYGRLSVLVQWLCEARPLFDVPARAFTPPPKVVSTVVRLVPRPVPACEANLGELERVTAAAFGQRRKMLRGSLRSLGPDGPALLAETGIAETARAEDLSLADFCALARVLARRQDKAPG